MREFNDFPESGKVSSKRHSSLSLLDKKEFVLMGVINVTPDSFFDGGKHTTPHAACDHGRKLLKEGADVLDIGGESSRPGALPVSTDEECSRVIPVLEKLRTETDVPISIDTTKAAVAKEALDTGATWVNDISAGRLDAQMAPLAAKKQCPVILMHSRETPETMQRDPAYDDVVQEVTDELLAHVKEFIAAGVLPGNIIIDPGIGFAKRFEDNITLLRNVVSFVRTGYPVLIGTSRKSFIGHITGKEVNNRIYGTLGSIAAAFIHGARLFRVHDVEETKDFLNVLSTIEKSG